MNRDLKITDGTQLQRSQQQRMGTGMAMCKQGITRVAAALALATCVAGSVQAADSAIGQLSVLGDATVGQASDAVGISYNVMVYFSGDPVVLQENTSAVLRLSDGVGSVSVLGNGSFSVSGDGDNISAEVDANEIEFSFARDKKFVVATECFTITSTQSRAPATGSIGSSGNLIVTNGEVAVRSQGGTKRVATTGESISCDRIAGATVAATAGSPLSGGQLWQAAVAATTGIAAVAIARTNDPEDENIPEDFTTATTATKSNGLVPLAASSGLSLMAGLGSSSSGRSDSGAGVAAKGASKGTSKVASAPQLTIAGGRGKGNNRRPGHKPGNGGKPGHGGIPPEPSGAPASPTKGHK